MEKVIPNNAKLIPKTASRVFKGEIFSVYQWPQAMFDGSQATFEMVKRPDTVEAICIVGDRILVLDDEQPDRPAKRTFPGGRVDDTDDNIVSAAKREVLEETGYEFTNWRLLTVRQPQGKIEWFIYTFLAWDGRRIDEPHPDSGEKITIELLSLDEVKDLAAKKTGYLGESADLLRTAQTTNDLLSLREFQGKDYPR